MQHSLKRQRYARMQAVRTLVMLGRDAAVLDSAEKEIAHKGSIPAAFMMVKQRASLNTQCLYISSFPKRTAARALRRQHAFAKEELFAWNPQVSGP